jgi:hypothetical protein
MPRKAQNVPANEKTDARFIRVATSRVNSLLQGLKQLGSLGNPKQYESKPEQRKQISDALHAGLDQALDTLNKGGATPQEFKLNK